MSNIGGIISAPVDLGGDVYPVLGLSSQQGCSLGLACLSTKVNQCSRRKPYVGNKLFSPTDDELAKMNYGLTPVPVTNGEGWEQQLPPTVYRLDDFNGYNHYAQECVGAGALIMKFPGGLDGGSVLILDQDDRLSMSLQIEGEENVELGLWDFYDPASDFPLSDGYITMVFGPVSGNSMLGAGGHWVYQSPEPLKNYKGKSDIIEMTVDEEIGRLERTAQKTMSGFYLAVGITSKREFDMHNLARGATNLQNLISLDMWGHNKGVEKPAIFEMRTYRYYALKSGEQLREFIGSDYYIPAPVHITMDLNNTEAAPTVSHYYNRGQNTVYFHCQAPWIVRTGNLVECNIGSGKLACTVMAVCTVKRVSDGAVIGQTSDYIGVVDINGKTISQVNVAVESSNGQVESRTVGVKLNTTPDAGGSYILEIQYIAMFRNEGDGAQPHDQYYKDINGSIWPIVGVSDGTGLGLMSKKGRLSEVLVNA